MKTDTSNKIIRFIDSKGQVTAQEITDFLLISRQATFRQLKKLIKNKDIAKRGKPPKVFYFIQEKPLHKRSNEIIEKSTRDVIKNNFLIITPSGQKKEGWEGFLYWCEKNKQPIKKTADNYVKTLKKYDKFRINNLIDGIFKLKNSFSETYLEHLYYLDFYSIERFGKTKLGQLLLYAKQSQNKILIRELIKVIEPQIRHIIAKHKIDGVGFIPPTVRREVQFMKELEKNLNLNIRKIKITKIKTEIAVPQKTLSKLNDRVENAKETIFVEEDSKFRNILLIDDAVGSGATINETAKKIRNRKICTGNITGLAITGSFKGFDVISEV